MSTVVPDKPYMKPEPVSFKFKYLPARADVLRAGELTEDTQRLLDDLFWAKYWRVLSGVFVATIPLALLGLLGAEHSTAMGVLVPTWAFLMLIWANATYHGHRDRLIEAIHASALKLAQVPSDELTP